MSVQNKQTNKGDVKPQGRIPVSKKRIYLTLYAGLFMVGLVLFSLTSRRWSGYAYIASDKKQNILFLGESSSEKDCHRRSSRKISEGVRMTRFDQANSYFCGKYCFEIPLVTHLQRSQVSCLITRDSL